MTAPARTDRPEFEHVPRLLYPVVLGRRVWSSFVSSAELLPGS